MSIDDIELTVNGTDYLITEESSEEFLIACGKDDFATVTLSPCREYYQYDISPDFASYDDNSGTSHVSHHDGIVGFFQWVIGAHS